MGAGSLSYNLIKLLYDKNIKVDVIIDMHAIEGEVYLGIPVRRVEDLDVKGLSNIVITSISGANTIRDIIEGWQLNTNCISLEFTPRWRVD